MGIPLKRGRRRSYADYKPASRKKGPRNDPFRILFYLLLIGAFVWVYFNQDFVLSQFASRVEQASAIVGPTPTPTPPPQDFADQGEQAYQQGRLDRAIEYYRQAADLEPNNVEYHFQVARLLLFQSAMQYGQRRAATLEEALSAANRTILANPERPEGYAIMGKVLDWQGKPDQASSQILRALEINRNYALGQSYLAEALVDMDRWDQALETINTALELDPNNVDIRRDYGYVLERLGDYAGAATQYEAALMLHPNLPFLRMDLGRAYRVLGRYDEALDQFFAVGTIDPQNALVELELGRTYETYIGNPNSALEHYERAVELDPNFATPWVRIGMIQYLQAGYPQATVAFERALSLGVDDVDVYVQLGLAYANNGQCDSAIRYLTEAQNRSQGDERILDLALSGFELCSQPTPIPIDVLGTLTPAPAP